VTNKRIITMKYFTVLFLCLLTFSFAHSRKIYLKKGGDGGIFLKSGSGFAAGDTLVITASESPVSYFYLGQFKGTAETPLVITNEGGVVQLTTGFDFEHCEYVKLTGSGSKDFYGFQVRGSKGVAVTIHGRSAHLEVERFLAEDCAFGCWIKNEASCDASINDWVLDDIRVHDYRMKNLKIEGFYMGSTDANNATRPITCEGKLQYYRPSRLGNIKVYNGFIDGTGRPAIMLSNAQVGISEIYNNVVQNVGRELNDQQGTGISLGLYTRAYVHDNKVKNTLTWGIASLGGSGLIRIENNTVDSSGYLDGNTTDWAQNIIIDTRNTDPVDSTQFIIRGNKVSNPGMNAEHIRIYRTRATYSGTNIICNNLIKGKPAKVKVEPGVRWKPCSGTQEKSKSTLLFPAGIAAVGVAAFVAYMYFRKPRGSIG
jgi:hypothetical protein